MDAKLNDKRKAENRGKRVKISMDSNYGEKLRVEIKAPIFFENPSVCKILADDNAKERSKRRLLTSSYHAQFQILIGEAPIVDSDHAHGINECVSGGGLVVADYDAHVSPVRML